MIWNISFLIGYYDTSILWFYMMPLFHLASEITLGTIGVVGGFAMLSKKQPLLIYLIWCGALLFSGILISSLVYDLLAAGITNVVLGILMLLHFIITSKIYISENISRRRAMLGLAMSMVIAILPIIIFWKWEY